MRYMGSKARLVKHILPIILQDRQQGQTYVEPFCGGMNMMAKVKGKRIANDLHTQLIALWHALIYENWQPPAYISETIYQLVKHKPYVFPNYMVGYIGFNSFGGKWFGGYPRDKQGKRNYWQEYRNNILKQVPLLKGVELKNECYTRLQIPKQSIIYCDPPYKNTTGYSITFNHGAFWMWCRLKHNQGHRIYISECQAPNDFKRVWEIPVKNTISNLKSSHKKGSRIERLFIPKF